MNASVMLAEALAVDDEDALDLLQAGSVGVILLDIQMPQCSVIEVLEALDSPPNAILMSAHRFEGKNNRSVGHKLFSHQGKPVAPRRLLDEVEAALGSGE